MMNRKEFYEYVKDNVKAYLPKSYEEGEIKLQEVEKNNGLKLTGITIPNGDQRIVPTIYLDSLYQEYINGKDVDSCVGDVADMRIEACRYGLRYFLIWAYLHGVARLSHGASPDCRSG